MSGIILYLLKSPPPITLPALTLLKPKCNFFFDFSKYELINCSHIAFEEEYTSTPPSVEFSLKAFFLFVFK